ncbi:MAG TPA: hypothetical protein VLH80_08990 [Nitrospiraceae bacterium]|nr:hypothetical protein [Nitrospiraceae bacterium]
MLSMNGIIVCELILGGVLMSLIFTSLANTDLFADPSSNSKDAKQPDGFRTATKPGLAQIEFSPDVQQRFSDRLLGEIDGGGSGPSGK